jgi:protein TonB
MPHDLFDAAVLPSWRRPRRRFLTVFSVAFHAIVVTSIVVAQVFAVGPLPLPHRPLLFEEIRLVHLEIPVPSSPRRAGGPAAIAPVSPDQAPTTEPDTLTPDTDVAPANPGQTPGGSMLGVVNGIESLESLAAIEPVRPPSSPPPAPVRLHRGIEPPKKIADVPPAYPSIARTARVEGIVVLEAVIDARGNVASVEVLRSNAMLDQAAVDAVRRWQYAPALLNGEPVPVIVTITVRFQLK